MSRYNTNNPITQQGLNYGQNYGQNYGHVTKGRRTVDGRPHVCADGHNHATELEVSQCIDAHKVYVCSSNHMHTDSGDSKRCDEMRRERESLEDKELARQHEREMMDRQIKLADNLRCMGWNFKTNGMPPIGWNR